MNTREIIEQEQRFNKDFIPTPPKELLELFDPLAKIELYAIAVNHRLEVMKIYQEALERLKIEGNEEKVKQMKDYMKWYVDEPYFLDERVDKIMVENNLN